MVLYVFNSSYIKAMIMLSRSVSQFRPHQKSRNHHDYLKLGDLMYITYVGDRKS